MKDTTIYDTCIKAFPTSFDVEYYLSVLFLFPENEWFYPSNESDDAFTICKELAMMGIVAEKRLPRWSAGMFRGWKHEFLFRRDMLYQ